MNEKLDEQEETLDFTEVNKMRGIPKDRKVLRERIDELMTSGLSKSEATVKAIEENPPPRYEDEDEES